MVRILTTLNENEINENRPIAISIKSDGGQHTRVVIGYDDDKGKLLLFNPGKVLGTCLTSCKEEYSYDEVKKVNGDLPDRLQIRPKIKKAVEEKKEGEQHKIEIKRGLKEIGKIAMYGMISSLFIIQPIEKTNTDDHHEPPTHQEEQKIINDFRLVQDAYLSGIGLLDFKPEGFSVDTETKTYYHVLTHLESGIPVFVTDKPE